MKNLPLLLGTIIGTVVLVVVLAFVFSQPEKVKMVDTAILNRKESPSKGPENAKVTVVEFSDFQCPSCKAAEPIVKELLEKHPNDVHFIYRYYPLTTIHKNAQVSAQVGEAAHSLNKFWEMHDLLFAEQDNWAELDSDGFNKKLDEYLTKLAIDKTEFLKRMESKEVKDVVANDVADGNRAGVDGTPTFYVNGQLTSAPQLVTTVESALSSN